VRLFLAIRKARLNLVAGKPETYSWMKPAFVAGGDNLALSFLNWVVCDTAF